MDDLKLFVRNLGIDLCGVVQLSLEGTPTGMQSGSLGILKEYQYALVMGAQLGK